MKDVLNEIERIIGLLADNKELTETEDQLIFTNLNEFQVSELEVILKASLLTYHFYDSEQAKVSRFPLSSIYNTSPFSLYINKEKVGSDYSLCVSLKFFRNILNNKDLNNSYVVWGMNVDLPSLNKRFAAFSESTNKNTKSDFKFKSPREIVKCSSTKEIPLELSFLVLKDNPDFDANCSFHKLWVDNVLDSYFICLSNEYDVENKIYKFKGPPKLNLKFNSTTHFFDVELIKLISKCVLWVYSNPKNAESKHLFLSSEIPAFESEEGNALIFFRCFLNDAFEAAKTAYKLSISDLSKDTIKSLTDLRKAIVDETSKIADFTRQIANTIIIALGASVGLVSSKISQNLSVEVLFLLATIVLFYIVFLIYSAWHQLSIQKEMRLKWRQKLYKFISSMEFDKLVVVPTQQSERHFVNVSISLGCISLILYITFAVNIFNKEPAAIGNNPSSALISSGIRISDIEINDNNSDDKSIYYLLNKKVLIIPDNFSITNQVFSKENQSLKSEDNIKLSNTESSEDVEVKKNRTESTLKD